MLKRLGKIAFIALLVVLTLGILAACDNGSGDDGGGDGSNPIIKVDINMTKGADYSSSEFKLSDVIVKVERKNGDTDQFPLTEEYIKKEDLPKLQESGWRKIHVLVEDVGAVFDVNLPQANQETAGVLVVYDTKQGSGIPEEKVDIGFKIENFGEFSKTSRSAHSLIGWWQRAENATGGAFYRNPAFTAIHGDGIIGSETNPAQTTNYPIVIDKKTRFEALWDENYIEVKFDLHLTPEMNAGDMQVETQIVRAITGNVKRPTETTEKAPIQIDGYTLAGWYVNYDEGTGEFSHPYSWASFAGEENLTLHAKWINTEHFVTFNANGGVWAGVEDVTSKQFGVYYYGDTVDLTEVLDEGGAPTKLFFKFAGWYEQQIPSAAAKAFNFEEMTTMPDRSVTVYAKWVPDESLPASVINNVNMNLFTVDTDLEGNAIITGINALALKSGIYHMVIPEELTVDDTVRKVAAIAARAFEGCSSLVSVSVQGTNLRSIGAKAFVGCSNINSVSLPESIAFVGANAFSDTNWWINHKGMKDGDRQTNYVYFGSVLLKYTGSAKVLDMNAMDTAGGLPSKIKSIAAGAFGMSPNLTEVTIADSIANIEANAFYDTDVKVASRLAKIIFTEGSNISKINMDALLNAPANTDYSGANPNVNGAYIIYGDILFGMTAVDFASVTEVTIPAGVTQINSGAFYSFENLAEINFDDGNASNIVFIGENAFNPSFKWAWGGTLDENAGDEFAVINGILVGVRSQQSIFRVPSYVTKIAPGAFKNSPATSNVILSSNVTIFANAFSNLVNLNVSFINDADYGDGSPSLTADGILIEEGAFLIGPGYNQKMYLASDLYSTLMGESSVIGEVALDGSNLTFRDATGAYMHYKHHLNNWSVNTLEISSLALGNIVNERGEVISAFPEKSVPDTFALLADAVLTEQGIKDDYSALEESNAVEKAIKFRITWLYNNYMARADASQRPTLVITRNDGASYSVPLKLEYMKTSGGSLTYIEFDKSVQDDDSPVDDQGKRYVGLTYTDKTNGQKKESKFHYTITAALTGAQAIPVKASKAVNYDKLYLRDPNNLSDPYAFIRYDEAIYPETHPEDIYYSPVRTIFNSGSIFNPTGLMFRAEYSDPTLNTVWTVKTYYRSAASSVSGTATLSAEGRNDITATFTVVGVDGDFSTDIHGYKAFRIEINIGGQITYLRHYLDTSDSPAGDLVPDSYFTDNGINTGTIDKKTIFPYQVRTAMPSTVSMEGITTKYYVGETINTSLARVYVRDENGTNVLIIRVGDNNPDLVIPGDDVFNTKYELRQGDQMDENGVIHRYVTFRYNDIDAGILTGVFSYTVEFSTPQNYFMFSVTDGEAYVTGLAATYPSILILPKVYTTGGNSYPVVGIAKGAFEDKQGIEEIYLPGYDAEGADGLPNDSFTYIGENAFKNAKSLKRIEITGNVSFIGKSAFEGTTSLTSIGFKNYGTETAPAYTSAITSLSPFLFKGSGITSFDMTKTGASITSIGEGVFQDAKSLTEVKFNVDASFSAIPAFAFMGTVSLDTFAIPDTITSIGNYAFANSKLGSGTGIVIPANVTRIGSYAFESSLAKSITFANDGENVTNIGDGAFRSSAIIAFTIPQGISRISKEMLAYTGITAITIPAKVTYVDEYAFAGTKLGGNGVTFAARGAALILAKGVFKDTLQMTAINLAAANISYISESLFEGSGLTSITVPASIKTIYGNAFKAAKLSEVNFTGATGLTLVEAYAFADCTSLTTLSMTGATNLEVVRDNAFAGCNLTSISFANLQKLTEVGLSGSGITVIDGFAGTTSLTTVIMPKGVTAIGSATATSATNGAFANSGIKSISIPATVKTIGKYAFYGAKLTNIDMSSAASLETFCEYSFSAMPDLEEITLPKQLKEIKEKAFRDSAKLVTVNTAAATMLATIGNDTFGNCPKLETFAIPAGLKTLGRIFGLNRSEDGANASTAYIKTVDTSNAKSLIKIVDSAFYNHFVLESIELPTSLQEIGADAFYGATKLKYVGTGNANKLTTIGNQAFGATTALENFTMPSALEIVPVSFMVQSGIKHIVIGRGVRVIMNNAFAVCNSLETIDFSDAKGLRQINTGAFHNLPELTAVDLSGATNLLVIQNMAFVVNPKMTSVTIGSSVKYVGSAAFGLRSNGEFSGLTYVNLKNASGLYYPSGIVWNDSNIATKTEAEIQALNTNVKGFIGAGAFYNGSPDGGSKETVTIDMGITALVARTNGFMTINATTKEPVAAGNWANAWRTGTFEKDVEGTATETSCTVINWKNK